MLRAVWNTHTLSELVYVYYKIEVGAVFLAGLDLCQEVREPAFLDFGEERNATGYSLWRAILAASAGCYVANAL